MRIAVADAGALFREGLTLQLRSAGHDVVGSFDNAGDLLDAASTMVIDVVILGIPAGDHLDGGLDVDSGLGVARRLRSYAPAIGLLLLSHEPESRYLMQMLEIDTRAIGYQLKDKIAGINALTETLRRIVAGEIVIESEVAAQLVNKSFPTPGALDVLHEREQEVLRLMAEGRSNASIAASMVVSVKAVEKHSSSIFAKLLLPEDSTTYHRRVLAVLAYLRGIAALPPQERTTINRNEWRSAVNDR